MRRALRATMGLLLGEQGAAVTELALSLLFLVPVLMYVIFLDDLLRYRLDGQEAALSTTWDATVADYSRKPPLGKNDKNRGADQIGGYARLMFCDHSSSYDSYSKPYDCDEEGHHSAVAAHVCWLPEKAKQVVCYMSESDKDVGADYSDSLASAFHKKFTNGGMVTCAARAAVMNYYIPQKLFEEFDPSDTGGRRRFDTAKQGETIHKAAKTLVNESNAFYFGQERLALLTDSWALNASKESKPGEKGGSNCQSNSSKPVEDDANVAEKDRCSPFWDRVNFLYTENSGYGALNGAYSAFVSLADSKFLAPGLSTGTSPGDDVTTPNLSVRYGKPQPQTDIEQDTGTGQYYATPWLDWARDQNKATYENRGSFYMGNDSEEKGDSASRSF